MKEKNYPLIVEKIVEEYQEHLNDWELQFISSLYDWVVTLGRPPSDKQKEILLKINRKRIERFQ